LLASTTTEEDPPLLVHSFDTYQLNQRFPCCFTAMLGSDLDIDPEYERGAWIMVPGIVHFDYSYPDGEALIFFPNSAPEILVPFDMSTFDGYNSVWHPVDCTPPAECDSCKFAILISGGIDAANNRDDYQNDLYDYYCCKISAGYCPENIKVFYDHGDTVKTSAGNIPPERTASATKANIIAHINSLKDKVHACSNAHKKPQLEFMATNHGASNGDIELWDPESISSAELVVWLQALIDTGLKVLDAEFGECFGGAQVNGIRHNLKTKGCETTASSAVDSSHTSSSWAGKKGYNIWLKAKVDSLSAGKSLHQAISGANKYYDGFLKRYLISLGRRARICDSLAADTTKADSVRAKARAKADTLRNDSMRVSGSIGGEQYFRSLNFTKYCEWKELQVTPGGSIEITFSGDSTHCGNCKVYRRKNGSSDSTVAIWNWNIPGSYFYSNGNNVRTISCDSTSSGIFWLHNDNGGFTAKAVSTNPHRTTSPSNPEAFAGFSLGGRDESSAEFGEIVAGSHTAHTGLGELLQDFPRILGDGGVSELHVIFNIPVQNMYWEDMELFLKTLPGSGAELQIQCAQAEIPDTMLTITGADVFVVPLGGVNGVGDHALILSASGGSIEFDAWGLRTAVSTATPPPVRDLTISLSGTDVVLNWIGIPSAVGYNVYYSSQPYVNWTFLGTTTAEVYTHVDGAQGGGKYFYRVVAVY
jgi:hypothetical protein